VKKRAKRSANDNDPEYPVCDENGRCFDWFVAGLADYLDGDPDRDIGKVIGKHMHRAEKRGRLPKPLPGGIRL
jgi:hypothetical protein